VFLALAAGLVRADAPFHHVELLDHGDDIVVSRIVEVVIRNETGR